MKNNTNNGLVDIIVPVWNSDRYVSDFFGYMDRQTYKNFSIHFVYDESSDNTLEELIRHKEKSSISVEILIHPNRCGQGLARNYALDNAALEGEYIIFLDIDDYPEDDFLETMVNTIIDYKTDVVICGFEAFDDNTGKVINRQMINCPEEVITDFRNYPEIAYMNFCVWNKMYRKEILRDARFTFAKDTEDIIFFTKLLPYINSAKFINRVLYHYRISSFSAQSRVTPDKFKQVWRDIGEVAEHYKENPETYKGYDEILELIIFIKYGIGLTQRIALKDLIHSVSYSKYSKKKMDRYSPGWRGNSRLSIHKLRDRRIQALVVAVCADLYKINMFPLFLYTYALYKKIAIKDMRW